MPHGALNWPSPVPEPPVILGGLSTRPAGRPISGGGSARLPFMPRGQTASLAYAQGSAQTFLLAHSPLTHTCRKPSVPGAQLASVVHTVAVLQLKTPSPV